MPVESAFTPPPGKGMSGQAIGKTVQTDQYWQEKAKEARARREYEEEQKSIDALRNPPAAPEPPVKMTGSINLGTIDFQEQTRKAQEAEQIARTNAEAEATRLRTENDKLKNELIANTISNLQNTLSGQIQKLQADLVTGRGSSKNIAEQLKEVIDSAALLGYVRPDQQPKAPVLQNATDAAVSLEMLRLQLEDKKSDRQFAWQMEKDRRQWQLDLRKLDQANKIAMAEAGSKKERDALIFKAPEILGSAIAKGLLAGREGGEIASNPRVASRSARPQARPAEHIVSENQHSLPKVGQPGYEPSANRRIEANIGESGSIDCPECGQPIAIGPTATRGVCAQCDYTVDIIRREVSDDAQS